MLFPKNVVFSVVIIVWSLFFIISFSVKQMTLDPESGGLSHFVTGGHGGALPRRCCECTTSG